MKTDQELQRDVMEELRWDPLLKEVAPQIGVSAKAGVVTLSGLVNTYSKKLAAERAAQRVAGVRAVAVDLEVKLELAGEKTDPEIAEAIRSALRWQAAVNSDKVEVKVDNGWVYLNGEVDWDYERRAAANAVRNLIGVRGVTNNILLRPIDIKPTEIQHKIAAAFHRTASLDSSAIQVNIKGSRVTLSGKVRSWVEKKEAEKVAWSSPGITEVENKIEVDSGVLVG